jgi:hypothetical protein
VCWHDKFLRVMYENTAEHTSLIDAVPAVERFLASQPTLLQMKFDLLAAYRAHVLSELLTKAVVERKVVRRGLDVRRHQRVDQLLGRAAAAPVERVPGSCKPPFAGGRDSEPVLATAL